MRKPIWGGLAEKVVDGKYGYEDIVLPAWLVDGAPAPAGRLLRKVRIHKRRLSDGELAGAGLLAGVTAEVAKTIVLHPLDTIKTRVQARQGQQAMAIRQPSLQPSEIQQATERPQEGQLTSPLDETAGASAAPTADLSTAGLGTPPLPLTELLSDLYTGLGPALASAAPQAGIFFAVRELVGRDLRDQLSGAGLSEPSVALVAIGAASLAYWLVRAPSDVLKQGSQLQLQQGGEAMAPKDAFAAAASVLRLGLSAYPACVLADLPAIFARLLAYRALGQLLLDASPGLPPTLLADEFLTVVVACAVAALTTPLDVLRTRTLQRIVLAEASRAEGGLLAAQAAQQPGVLGAAFAELQEEVESEGAAVLFAGVVPRVLWNGIVVGATTPLRSMGYFWARDAIILELFDDTVKGLGTLRMR